VVRQIPGEARAESPWCFLTQTWRDTLLDPVVLKSVVRSKDEYWNKILNQVRTGEVSREAIDVLQSRIKPVDLHFQGTRLFARRMQVESLNQERLKTLKGSSREYNTVYMGNAQKIDDLKRNAPIPEVLVLKEGAL